jgi:hypothetical protein
MSEDWVQGGRAGRGFPLLPRDPGILPPENMHNFVCKSCVLVHFERIDTYVLD